MTAASQPTFTLIHGSDDGSRLTLGDDVAVYLQHKRKRLTAASQRGYFAALMALVDYFTPDTTVSEFEGAAGTRKIETFLAEQWGEQTGRTYNKNLSIIRGFFGWCADRDRLRKDPTKLIEKAKERQFLRQSFSDAEHDQILEANPEPCDWLPLRLLLDFGIRKEVLGSRQARATVTHLRASKEWVRLTLDAATEKITRLPAERIGDHGAHSWWYRCLTRAGVVEPGTTSGTRMHSARHTSAQRVLERTGNIKDAQALLGHTSSATTDRYVGWSDSNLEASMKKVLNV